MMSSISTTNPLSQPMQPVPEPSPSRDPAVARERKIHKLSAQLHSLQGLPFITSVDKGFLTPAQWRMASIVPTAPVQGINLEGLQELRLSGSAQFTEPSWNVVKKKIREVEGLNTPIVDVDLTQENHWHVRTKQGKGSIAFSSLKPLSWWVGPNRTPEQIDQSEREQAQEFQQRQRLKAYMIVDSIDPKTLTKDHHTVTGKVRIEPKEILTEQQILLQDPTCIYARIPDRKFGPMEWEHVDALVDLVKQSPQNSHFHFHCRKGLSRTTLFMVMFDMMKNAHRVSADDIIKRQGPAALRGVDLLACFERKEGPESWDASFKRGWVNFLRQFHQYVLDNREIQFRKSWSTWAQEHSLPTPQQVPLEDTYTGPSLDVTIPFREERSPLRERALILTGSFNESKSHLQNFRDTQGLYLGLESHPQFRRAGLQDMRVAGCSQYSDNSFSQYMKDVTKKDPRAKVHVFDFQHYDHVLLNGMDVCQLETRAEFENDERTAEDIIHSENALKESLLRERGVRLLAVDTHYPKEVYDTRFSFDVRPERVETPKEFLESKGAQYHLLPTGRFSGELAVTEVDLLSRHVLEADEHTYSLFHCKMGSSRTTLFLASMDILYNADKLSMEDIVRRQELIGVMSLFNITSQEADYPQEKQSKIDRVVFLARFHEYAKTVFIPAKKSGHVPQSWAEWSRIHSDFRPDIRHLLIDNSGKRKGGE